MMSQKSSTVRFTEREAEYLMEKQLGRIATVSSEGPHVVPIVYEFDGRYIYFSGWNLKKSQKFRNIRRNNRVALVVDDLAPVGRWAPRGIEIRGLAEAIEKDGYLYVRITPLRKVSWGL